MGLLLPQAETEDPSNEVTEDVAEEATEEAPSIEAPGVPESEAGSVSRRRWQMCLWPVLGSVLSATR